MMREVSLLFLLKIRLGMDLVFFICFAVLGFIFGWLRTILLFQPFNAVAIDFIIMISSFLCLNSLKIQIYNI